MSVGFRLFRWLLLLPRSVANAERGTRRSAGSSGSKGSDRNRTGETSDLGLVTKQVRLRTTADSGNRPRLDAMDVQLCRTRCGEASYARADRRGRLLA